MLAAVADYESWRSRVDLSLFIAFRYYLEAFSDGYLSRPIVFNRPAGHLSKTKTAFHNTITRRIGMLTMLVDDSTRAIGHGNAII
jgi:hypothetical protein